MPIYEYQCDGCADRFEVKQGMKDDALTTCQKCGQHVQRLISSPAIMFKGSGWYVTDYSDKMKPSSGSEAPAAKTGEKKEVAAATSEQSTAANAAPATPAPTPAAAAAPAGTPSSTASPASSSPATSTPSSSAAK